MSENVIIAAQKLAHALQNPSPQAPFSNIGNSQMVVIQKLSGIFSKVAFNLHQKLDHPQQQPVTKSAPIPHKVRPTRARHINSERPRIIEDGDRNTPKDFQCNVRMSPTHHSTRRSCTTTKGASCATYKGGHERSKLHLQIQLQEKICPKLFIDRKIWASQRSQRS